MPGSSVQWNPIINCTSPQICDTGTGNCCTPSWGACGGCTPTCSSSCAGSQSDGCGNTRSCTIPISFCNCPVSASYIVAPIPNYNPNVSYTATNNQSTVWCFSVNSTITGVTESDSNCIDPNAVLGDTCTPIFSTLSCPAVCQRPSFCPSCSSTGVDSGCGYTCTPRCSGTCSRTFNFFGSVQFCF